MLQSRPRSNPTSSKRPAAPTQARDALATAGNPPLRPHYQADSVSEAPCSTHSEGAPPLSGSGPAAAARSPLLGGLCRDCSAACRALPPNALQDLLGRLNFHSLPARHARASEAHPGHKRLASPLTTPQVLHWWCSHAACVADRHTSIYSAPWRTRNWQQRHGERISSGHSQHRSCRARPARLQDVRLPW